MKIGLAGLAALCVLGPVHGQGSAANRDQSALKKAAYNVDKHVAALYRRKKLPVPAVVDDPTFLRRSFLVSAGRIPTLDEARMFLEIEDADKREMLSDYLTESDGYRSHMINWVLDLLRVQDGFGNRSTAAPYVEFVRQGVANNMPWDKFAKKIVGSKGSAWGDGNGGVGYYLRDKGMPLDNLSNTMRIFLGERMECAQCHDSPYNKWERMDFYELAAFTNGQGEMNRGPWNTVWREERDKGTEREEFGRLIRWLGDNVHSLTLGGGGDGRIKLPGDYQYKDGDPGEMVGGRTHFGTKIRGSDRKASGDGRKEFAEWMVDPKNERFTITIVNRMWERVMGNPIFDPVDEFVAPDKTVTPELVRYLAGLMREMNYDLRAFQHVLLLTKTFQFAANPEAFEAGVPQAFNGRQIERMTAEQVWDSLVTLTAGNPDKLPKRSYSDTIFYNNKAVLVGKKSMEQLSREVLAIKDAKAYRAYARDLLQEMKKGNSGGGKKGDMMMGGAARPGPVKGMARASELATPTRAGHFLRDFGQSDRELIDSATKEANMAQVLAIMNGHVEKMVVSNSNAAVYKALEDGSSERDKVRFLFYSILSRPPSDAEMGMLMRDVIDGSQESYRNLVSALLSTHEFIFIQ
jgi:hypothetical protein